MGRRLNFAVASVLAAVAIPSLLFYITLPSKDPLADKLRDYRLFPVKPPRTVLDVGALYYVSADVSDLQEICPPPKADLETAISESTGGKIEEDLRQGGGLTTKVKLNFGSLVNGASDDAYVQNVHLSLENIVFDEIPLGRNSLIYQKLMSKPECSETAGRLVKTFGYVCQTQKILRANVDYIVDRDDLKKFETHAEATAGKGDDDLKTAIDTESNQRVTERDGKLEVGSALDYGVDFTPTCLAPPHARFARVLPRTRFDRAVNFVLYHVVEPLLPPTPDEEDVAQNAH